MKRYHLLRKLLCFYPPPFTLASVKAFSCCFFSLLLCFGNIVYAQSSTVSGLVKDENGTLHLYFAPRLSAGTVTGWPQSNPGGSNIPTNDIINAYETGDKRKDASIGQNFKSPVTGDVVPYIKKYDHPHSIAVTLQPFSVSILQLK